MRPLHLLVIASIFGAIVVLGTAIFLMSPALMPATSGPISGPTSGDVQYALDVPLPGPRYYTGIDFDMLTSNDHLTVIPLKSYRQQMTNYSCGAAAAMTVMSWYKHPANNTDADEERVAREMFSNVTEKTGINPEQVAAWFNRQGMHATWGTGGTREMLRNNLKNGVPTMVEWMDWGGHWVVVVGYDTRGTETVWDDVIIFADSVDCCDDRIDGISYANYGQFDAMWSDPHYFPENMRERAYVVVVPGSSFSPS